MKIKKFFPEVILCACFFTAYAFFANAQGVVFDPTTSYNTVNEIVEAVSNYFLSFVAGLAILFLIIGGIYYLTAFGDDKRMEEGKKIITYTVYGLVIILISYSVVTTLNAIIFG